MTDTIDISTELRALTDKLGLEYSKTLEILFTPGQIKAQVYEPDENGEFTIFKNGEETKHRMRLREIQVHT